MLVTNGRDIVVTDEQGQYEIPVEENTIVSVINPPGWTTYTDEKGIPGFYYIHSPDGTGGTDFDGLAPTGPLSESVDFALYPQQETDAFRVPVFGDTQPRNMDE